MEIGFIMVKSKKRLKLRLPRLRATKEEMWNTVEKIASLRQFYHFVELKGTQTTEIHKHPLPTWDKIHPILPSDISEMKCIFSPPTTYLAAAICRSIYNIAPCFTAKAD